MKRFHSIRFPNLITSDLGWNYFTIAMTVFFLIIWIFIDYTRETKPVKYSARFRRQRIMNWVYIGVTKSVQLMSRLSLLVVSYYLLGSKSKFVQSSSIFSLKEHELDVMNLVIFFIFPLFGPLVWFIVDISRVTIKTSLVFAIACHVGMTFMMGLLSQPSYQKIFDEKISQRTRLVWFGICYALTSILEMLTHFSLVKITGLWYEHPYERKTITAIFGILDVIQMVIGYQISSMVFQKYIRVDAILFVNCLFIVLCFIGVLVVKQRPDRSDDGPYFIYLMNHRAGFDSKLSDEDAFIDDLEELGEKSVYAMRDPYARKEVAHRSPKFLQVILNLKIWCYAISFGIIGYFRYFLYLWAGDDLSSTFIGLPYLEPFGMLMVNLMGLIAIPISLYLNHFWTDNKGFKGVIFNLHNALIILLALVSFFLVLFVSIPLLLGKIISLWLLFVFLNCVGNIQIYQMMTIGNHTYTGLATMILLCPSLLVNAFSCLIDNRTSFHQIPTGKAWICIVPLIAMVPMIVYSISRVIMYIVGKGKSNDEIELTTSSQVAE